MNAFQKLMEFARRKVVPENPCRGEMKYKEDYLLDHKVLQLIMNLHDWAFLGCERHVVVGNEFDAVAIAETFGGKPRFIAIELKENDVVKVLRQAMIRSMYVHVAYAVLSSLDISNYTLPHIEKAVRSGIGIILYDPETMTKPKLIAGARVNKHPTLLNIFEDVLRKQYKLI